MTVDPRIQAVVGEDHYPCGGTCPLSRNQHVHFPDEWVTFLDALSLAMAEDLPAAEPAPDPRAELASRWQTAFAIVWGDIKAEIDEPLVDRQAAILKAMEVALDIAR